MDYYLLTTSTTAEAAEVVVVYYLFSSPFSSSASCLLLLLLLLFTVERRMPRRKLLTESVAAQRVTITQNWRRESYYFSLYLSFSLSFLSLFELLKVGERRRGVYRLPCWLSCRAGHFKYMGFKLWSVNLNCWLECVFFIRKSKGSNIHVQNAYQDFFPDSLSQYSPKIRSNGFMLRNWGKRWLFGVSNYICTLLTAHQKISSSITLKKNNCRFFLSELSHGFVVTLKNLLICLGGWTR